MLSFVLTVALVTGLATASSGQVLGATTEDQQIVPSDPQTAFLGFSWSVAINGDTMVIGAPDFESQAGAAYVFTNTARGLKHKNYNGGSGRDTCTNDPAGLTEQTTRCEILSPHDEPAAT